MTLRFREFVKGVQFKLLMEQEAAPSMGGAPPAPGNPDGGETTNKHHFDTMKRQFGIDDESFQAALEQGVIDIWKVPNYANKWGYIVQGPVSAQVEERDDGNYSITYMLVEKKRMNPKHFLLPYKEGDQPPYYEGPVKDETEIISSEELQDAMAEPMKNGGAPPGGMGMGGGGMGGMGGGMGGMPPAGGAPPMGGPPGGMV